MLKKHWKIHLIHHTHLDVGYTHAQDEVLALQYRHLENAMNLIDKSLDKSDKAVFKWNPEITWAIEQWLKITTEEQKSRFIKYVQNGQIGLDALYGNVLTGLCRPEELMNSFSVKNSLELLTEKAIDSAMITDIPGWNWGLVTTLAENNVKYLSVGPNRSDRIGHILNVYGDKPFYWHSASDEQILVYVHGKGYSWFHTGMKNDKNLSRKLTPNRLATYLKNLEKEGYPYDTILLRYNIGQDNGPPDANLSNIVEKWNKKYLKMQLSISTTSAAMKEFEKDYGTNLPHLKGDITPYWEDGAASTARETAVARRAGETLIQVEALAAMTGTDIDLQLLDSAWKDVFLFNEHTWGAYNSISKPDHPFAVTQWNWKKRRSIDGREKAELMLQNISVKNEEGYITVFNTHSWDVKQIVVIKGHVTKLMSMSGEIISIQRLRSGDTAILVDIPALESNVYSFERGGDAPEKPFQNLELSSKCTILDIDPSTGDLRSVLYNGQEMLKESNHVQFNRFVYKAGKWGQRDRSSETELVSINIVEDGDLLTKALIKKHGTTSMISSEITLFKHDGSFVVKNTLDRETVRSKEGIYFEFPFQLKNPAIRYDTMYGISDLRTNQLPGSNKNFITATRWFDISGEANGITCALIDAPIFKVGKLVHDPVRSGPPSLCGWRTSIDFNGNLYSYVMNNYWMTNYKADQPGETSFVYGFKPHDFFSAITTQKYALEMHQPLLVKYGFLEIKMPLVKIVGDGIIITTLKDEGTEVNMRLHNIDLIEHKIFLEFSENFDIKIISPNKENKLLGTTLTLQGNETIALTLRRFK